MDDQREQFVEALENLGVRIENASATEMFSSEEAALNHVHRVMSLNPGDIVQFLFDFKSNTPHLQRGIFVGFTPETHKAMVLFYDDDDKQINLVHLSVNSVRFLNEAVKACPDSGLGAVGTGAVRQD